MTSETGNGSSADGANKGPDANPPPSKFTRSRRHLRANRRWKEKRNTGPGRRIPREDWTYEEAERAARLLCWGLTRGAIGKILGRTEFAVHKYVRKNRDIVDVFKKDEEHVLNWQDSCPAEEEEEEETYCNIVSALPQI
ncbi:hypothetical protein CEP52_006449 [Fusarium oligoseptatum]|uniref:Uncharacterized protein n=1 Tax=Fusarium oligoseptatum TaxID=2604345 RepID=A0A428TT34_9HYPO|nr:hypothetical protein CEP52_006449 [Fusarium oligoseptatum]